MDTTENVLDLQENKMPIWLKSLIVTLVALGAAIGWVALLSIDGMSGWYYGSIGSLIVVLPVWAATYAVLRQKPQDRSS